MALGLYMDHNVSAAVTQGLRLRGVDVITAHEDGSHRLEDADLLDRAGDQGRVITLRWSGRLAPLARLFTSRAVGSRSSREPVNRNEG